jgi:hypothetical protein
MVKAQFDLGRLVHHADAHFSNGSHRALNGCSQWNENAATLVDRGDQDGGDLCARMRGIGADRLLNANLERGSSRNRLGGEWQGRSEEHKAARRSNETAEPVRQSRLLSDKKVPISAAGARRSALTLSRVHTRLR